MKIPCEIIQDLVPLYEEELCSEATRLAVEEHLAKCESCCKQTERIKNLFAWNTDSDGGQAEEKQVASDESAARMDAAVSRSFRKIRRRWVQSLFCTVLILPILIMSVNQFRKEGICFTNPDDILAVRRFVLALEKGDWEKAASYMDYEELYQVIQEIVIPYPDTDGAEYTTVVLNREAWVATDSFFQEYLRWEEHDENIWGNIIYNQIERTMIPLKVWEEIMAMDPDSAEQTDEGEWIVNGAADDAYVRLDTRWGAYVVSQGSGLEKCTTAEAFCNALDLIPMEIFEEAYPELKEYALSQYLELQELYEEAQAMTLEEFTDIVRSNCIEELAYCAEQGISFKCTGYQGSYYIRENGCWIVTYGLLVMDGEERTPITVSYGVRDGKLRLSSAGYRDDYDAHDVVMDALSVHYVD